MSRHVPRFTATVDDTGRPVVRCTFTGCDEETRTTNPTGIAAWKRDHARAAQSPVAPRPERKPDPWAVPPAVEQYLADRRAARAQLPTSDTPPF